MKLHASVRHGLIGIAAGSILAFALPAAADASMAGSHHGHVMSAAAVHPPKHKLGRGTSTNWSGYAIDGTSATHVIATWTEPTVTCSAGETSWSSPWVGIDGDNSGTVEQIGTDSDCQKGVPTYYAWWEMYPKSLVSITMTVHPGDSMTGEVTYSSGSFVLKLTDNTTKASFTTTQSSRKAQRTSVEWIMEGPSSGLLSNFGSVPFSSASATINGHAGTLGSFSQAQSITMESQQGVVRALPSSVTNGTSFSVSWKHS